MRSIDYSPDDDVEEEEFCEENGYIIMTRDEFIKWCEEQD